MPTVTPEPIMKIAMGFMAAKFLFVASEIGLFEALASGPATLKELAERIAAPLRTVGIVSAATCAGGSDNDCRCGAKASDEAMGPSTVLRVIPRHHRPDRS